MMKKNGKNSKKSTHFFSNDSRVEKMTNLPLTRSLKVVYLHNNAIRKIDNLNSAIHLTHLYLQRNEITRIENLDALTCLKKLYLGYNCIHRLENVSNLMQLEELHLECQRFSGEFEFDANSLNTLKTLNVSGLRLKDLSFLSGFVCLEHLIATDNSFERTIDITSYLNRIPTIIQVDFRRCPAQQDFYYRNRISSTSDSLQILDDKPIQLNTKLFLRNLEKLKNRRATLRRMNNPNMVMDINLVNESVAREGESIDFANIIAEAMAEYKSWNTLKPNHKLVRQSSPVPSLREKRPNCEDDEDVIASMSLQTLALK